MSSISDRYCGGNNCRNSRALIGQFLWSICGQAHEFEIHPTRQRARADNSTICFRKKTDIKVAFFLYHPNNRLNWDNLSTRRKKLKATLMFKIIKGLSPAYLQDLFSIRSTPYNLRDSEIKLNLPKPRTNYCKRALSYSGALLWNSLPVNVRKSDFFGYFKREQSL